MTKKDRLNSILTIIRSRDVETQEDLARALRELGYEVTQATVSRDIRELHLTKVRTHDGRFKYSATERESRDMADRYIRVLRDGYVSMDQAQNILVVRTVSGMAMAVAAALDAMQFPELVGCIAGDDTIMAAVRTTEDTTALMARLHELIGR